MAKELTSLGSIVTVLTNHGSKMQAEIEKFCRVVNQINGENYDLAIINHSNCWDKIPNRIPKVFTSHSAFIDIEQFPDDCEHRVGVTELTAKGNKIIRNGIDCSRFKPTKVNNTLKNILYLSNPNYREGLEIVREACHGYNLMYLESEVFSIEDYINKADLVISMSRGALEAMACGKNVIYGDKRAGWMDSFQGGGMITPQNFNKFKEGEYIKNPIRFTAESLRREINKYDPNRGIWLRKRILNEFNIRKTCQEYLQIYTKRDTQNTKS